MSDDSFMDEDFLLDGDPSRHLYHEYAETMPIIDYHCHLPPRQIAEDYRFRNMADVWLSGDHYKWRAMRANGVAERYCSGDAPDREKFQKWAETMPRLLRNPLYHWTHLELKRYFGISNRVLCPETAEGIWSTGAERLQGPAFSARGLMKQSRVVLVCTTDDPVDDLRYHRAVAECADFDVAVLPTWRPDKAMAVEDAGCFNAWTDALAEASGVEIRDYASFMEAIEHRHSFFHERGCRLSDHGLETAYAEDYTEREITQAFSRIRDGKELDQEQILKLKSAMLYDFGLMDGRRNWTQQYHFGALRNNNSRACDQIGPDAGFDSIGDVEVARPLSRLLDRLNSAGGLTRTILYNLNPRDNAVMVTMLGNFQDDSVPGKMQHGSAWWFLDHKHGMEEQLEILSNMGLLSRFVGMLTDSRSFLSYTRHEYFRRILCNLLGRDMEKGLIPADFDLVGGMVQDICYNNAAGYFGFEALQNQ